MAFPLFEDAILTVDLPDRGLCAGDVGVVVEQHAAPGKPDGYSVEFFDMTGRTVAVVTLPATSIRRPTSADRPTTQQLAHAQDA